jgi:hypothetical protein
MTAKEQAGTGWDKEQAWISRSFSSFTSFTGLE